LGDVSWLCYDSGPKKEEKISSFTAEHDANVMMFGATAVTVEEGQPNVMVLGADVSGGQANVVLRLMYIDPAQFAAQDAPASQGQA